MNRKWMRPALAASVLAIVIAQQVEARDPNTAAGIQDVIQGVKEVRRFPEERLRLFESAVSNLNKGLANDPNDGEAWIYLGRAYGELDSLEQAGKTFGEAIRRLQDNPKLLKRATDNRDFFFYVMCNWGNKLYKDATSILPAEEILTSTDPRAAVAKAKLAEAEAKFRTALALNPDRAIAYEKLATMLELQGKFDQARLVIEQGLADSMPKVGEEYERLMKRRAR